MTYPDIANDNNKETDTIDLPCPPIPNGFFSQIRRLIFER